MSKPEPSTVTHPIPSAVGCYQIVKQLGAGSFGEIHVGMDTRSGETVAVKFESIHNYPQQLRFEVMVYETLQQRNGFIGFPKLLRRGKVPGYRYMVLPMLGPSLDILRQHPKVEDGAMSLKTTLMLADQALQRLETLHSAGFVHRDLKPANLIMGIGDYAPVLHLIDFGLTKQYLTADGDHIPFVRDKIVVGTIMFMSINTHQECEQSRRDDLEALAYVMTFLGTGGLPWEDIDVRGKGSHKKTLQMKLEVPPEVICGRLPAAFAEWITYARGLGFEETPDYTRIRRSLHEAAAEAGLVVNDAQYDWV